MPSTPVVVLDSTLTSIANAIRSKTGGSATMTPGQMPAEIASISGGGSDDPHIEMGTILLPKGWSSSTNIEIPLKFSGRANLFYLFYSYYMFSGIRLFAYACDEFAASSGYQMDILDFTSVSSTTHGDSKTDGKNYIDLSYSGKVVLSGQFASVIGPNYLNDYKAFWFASDNSYNLLS